MSEVIEQQQSRDAKLADAFHDLEAPIRDLERAGKIAWRFVLEGDGGLALFAVEQFRQLATNLVRLYDERHSAAR
jgi:hypothetical protein